MGRLVNRMLAKNTHLSFRTVFVSSMSELLKQVVLDGSGVAWLPDCLISPELEQGTLIRLDEEALTIPIYAYAYRMDTRMSMTAESFWRDLRKLFHTE